LIGDNPIFAVNYGMTVKGWRHDITFDQKFSSIPPEGECLYVSNSTSVPEPYRCRPWGLVYRIYDGRLEESLPPPPPPYWMPPHFTRSERRNTDAQELLASLYLRQTVWFLNHGDKEKALEALGQSASAAPYSGLTLQNVAVLYSQLGEFDACERTLKQALGWAPHSFELLLNMGVYYGKIGQYGLCRKYLNRATQIDAHDPRLRQYFALLDQQSQGNASGL
jgi:tetratricopeptide (TPR) repeat protein